VFVLIIQYVLGLKMHNANLNPNFENNSAYQVAKISHELTARGLTDDTFQTLYHHTVGLAIDDSRISMIFSFPSTPTETRPS
jgi:hypothetical protein